MTRLRPLRRRPLRHRPHCHRPHCRRSGPALLLLALVPALPAALAACADEGGTGGGSAAALTGQAAEGEEIARTNGCVACHTDDGSDGPGPTFAGLYGREVELDDGSTVTADEAYLRRAIQAPQAQVAAGFDIAMPANDLSPDEVDAVVAYLRALGDR